MKPFELQIHFHTYKKFQYFNSIKRKVMALKNEYIFGAQFRDLVL